jgi:hypothetical protein
MVRLFPFLIAVMALACNIIDESAITSQQEFDNLKIKSLKITQELSSGVQSVTATVADSVLNVTSANGKINKQVKINWPDVQASSKLKFRCGETKNIAISNWYLENGRINSVLILASNVIKEIYSFRYNTSGKLINLYTEIRETTTTTITRDTLIYESNGSLTILRRSPDVAKRGTFVNGNMDGYNGSFSFQGFAYYNNRDNNSSNYSVFNGTPSDGDSALGALIRTGYKGGHLSLNDINQCEEGSCENWVDTFYFHPLMFIYLKDQQVSGVFNNQPVQAPVELDGTLFFFYMVDWWVPVSANTSTKNEIVTFTPGYDL